MELACHAGTSLSPLVSVMEDCNATGYRDILYKCVTYINMGVMHAQLSTNFWLCSVLGRKDRFCPIFYKFWPFEPQQQPTGIF